MCRIAYSYEPQYKRPHFIRFETMTGRIVAWNPYYRRFSLTNEVVLWCNEHGGSWIFHRRAPEIAFETASAAFHFKMRWAGC